MLEQGFFAENNHQYRWIEKLKQEIKKVNGDPDLVNDLWQTACISSYENLYKKYMRLPPSMRQDMKDGWQFIVLCGEPTAFRYLATQEDIRELYNYGAALHYAALSGEPDQLEEALKWDNQWDRPSNFGNILHYAILSGEPAQFSKVLSLEIRNTKLLSASLPKGRTVLHLAASTGNAEMFNAVLDFCHERGIEVSESDIHGCNAMDYAKYGKNEDIVQTLQNLGLHPSNHELVFGQAREALAKHRIT